MAEFFITAILPVGGFFIKYSVRIMTGWLSSRLWFFLILYQSMTVEAGGQGSIVRPDASGAGFVVLPQERTNPLTLEKAVLFFNDAVAKTAALSWFRIRAKYLGKDSLTDADRKTFSKDLDNEATLRMESDFRSGDFGIKVLDCEGKKEERKYGIVLNLLDGSYGASEAGEVEVFIDPIEGTTAASSNEVGSVAIVAGSLDSGHPLVPPEDGDAIYTNRIVAGPKLKGKISLDTAPKDVVSEAMKAYNFTDPSELKIVVLERERNAALISQFEEAGASIIRIKAGDLMPAIAALYESQPIISVGSGGKTEAMIAAIAAKAVGGVFEGQYVDKDGKPSVEHPQKLTLESVCPGNSSNYFVSLASITGTPEHALNLPPVMRWANGKTVNLVTTVDITKKGFYRRLRPIDL